LSGKSVQEAVEAGLNLMLERVGGTGGSVAVDSTGKPGIFFTTQGMAWAYCVGEELHSGIYKGEDIVQPI